MACNPEALLKVNEIIRSSDCLVPAPIALHRHTGTFFPNAPQKGSPLKGSGPGVQEVTKRDQTPFQMRPVLLTQC